MIKFDIITIFPKIFDSYFNESIIKRAQQKGLIKIKVHNLRDWASGRHKSVDDKPYGGGPGMILKVEPIYKALNSILRISKFKFLISKQLRKPKIQETKTKIVLLTPAGKQFDQKTAYRFSKLKRIIFICGRYEGVDARVEKLVDEKISVGPYILTGGELPAMTIVDAVSRLIPGVIRPESLQEESFSISRAARLRPSAGGLRRTLNFVSSLGLRQSVDPCASDKIGEYPQYTRPEALTIKQKGAIIKVLKVPKVLLSGNHQKIKEWRCEQ